MATSDLPPTAVRLRATPPGGPTVFAFAGGGTSALSLLPIAQRLPATAGVIGFHASGYTDRAVPDWSLRRVVDRHLEVLRAQQRHGPYLLIGHSYGGLLALETARRLADAGESVPAVVLLDTNLPPALVARGRQAVGSEVPEPTPEPAPGAAARWLMHARLVGAGLVRYRPEVRDAVFWEQSLRLINRHTLTTWGGRTVVITVPENPDDPRWWSLVLTGEHEIVRIPGGHNSMLREPFHEPVVARITDEMVALWGVPDTLSAGRLEQTPGSGQEFPPLG
ncbi:alpha/beta fold hydrolase [Nakamurella sp. YIM 132084]|uniref:Alpha/beta fold hydrolase n=1 Tax=Nakamurella leprariae TaxID=2803911 RepID=A0A939BXX0_9ACTN|nr:alpha/beta fold hydrolase [Nakamurella leprariae]